MFDYVFCTTLSQKRPNSIAHFFLPNINRFTFFFTATLSGQLAIKNISPHLDCVATLPRTI